MLIKHKSTLLSLQIDFMSLNQSDIKIAGFDLDSTIIKTKSGKIMPETKDDWMWFCNLVNIKRIFKNLIKQGFTIVIFSNQKNLYKRISFENFDEKITKIHSAIGFNVSWIFALENDYFRKPMTGMFNYYLDVIRTYYDVFGQIPNFNLNKSFYCGDAAGRVYSTKLKDHSYIDMYFAHNNNIRFITPEQLFLSDTKNHKIVHPYQNINLKKIFGNAINSSNSPNLANSPNLTVSIDSINQTVSAYLTNSTDSTNSINSTQIDIYMEIKNMINQILNSGKKICIMTVGCPGSGKTSIRKFIEYNLNLSNLFIYSPDDKTSIKELKKQMSKSNIFVDQTNPSFKKRSELYNQLNPMIYDFLIINLNLDKLLCKHLNYVRYLKSVKSNINDELFEPQTNKIKQSKIKINSNLNSKSKFKKTTQQLIPDIAYRVYFSHYEDPNMDNSKLSEDYDVKIINISNIKSIIDPQIITSEYFMYYDV